MDSRGFLHGALRVAGGAAGLPWMCVPELALFAAGGKGALRLVLGSAEGARMISVASDNGLFSAARGVATQPVGNTWASLLPTDDGDAPLVMVVLARDQHTADTVLRAEAAGDADAVGDALGYPPCCVAALPGLSRAGARWAEALVDRSGRGPFPWTANRLATAWGGMCAAGELFPCSLHCPSANAIGVAAESALHLFGLHRLASALREHGLSPVRILPDGAVVRASSGGNGAIVEFLS